MSSFDVCQPARPSWLLASQEHLCLELTRLCQCRSKLHHRRLDARSRTVYLFLCCSCVCGAALKKFWPANDSCFRTSSCSLLLLFTIHRKCSLWALLLLSLTHQLRVEHDSAMFAEVIRGPLQRQNIEHSEHSPLLPNASESDDGIEVLLPFACGPLATHGRHLHVWRGREACFTSTSHSHVSPGLPALPSSPGCALPLQCPRLRGMSAAANASCCHPRLQLLPPSSHFVALMMEPLGTGTLPMLLFCFRPSAVRRYFCRQCCCGA